MSKNLFDKIWDLHTVATLPSGQTQLFIGLHLIHEVTSPQAFAMLKERGLKVLRPDRTFATVDHIVPTDDQSRPYKDGLAEEMLQRSIQFGPGRVPDGWRGTDGGLAQGRYCVSRFSPAARSARGR